MVIACTAVGVMNWLPFDSLEQQGLQRAAEAALATEVKHAYPWLTDS